MKFILYSVAFSPWQTSGST